MRIEYYKRKQPLMEAIIFWPVNIPEIMKWLGPAFRGVINLALGNFKSATDEFPNIELPDNVREGLEAGAQYNVLVIASNDGFIAVLEGQYIVKDPVLGYIPTDRDAMGEFYTRVEIDTTTDAAFDKA